MIETELAVGLFVALLVLIALRMPIAIAMFLTGAVGFAYITSWHIFLEHMSDSTFSAVKSHALSVVPMFLLMGQFALHGGLSGKLFRAARAWLGHYRGGLAVATIGGCAGFGAICGSSLATGATMASVALPEMKRYGYSGSLATGALAAGGTLGILIPPSIILVIYAILTEQSITALFLAAFIPGIIATAGYMVAIMLYVRFKPEDGPAVEAEPLRDRFVALIQIWPIVSIFVVVIGGMYVGVFTPTEGAAIGVVATGILAFSTGDLRMGGLIECLLETLKMSGMIFIILLGAEAYSAFLALSQVPQALAAWIGDSGLPPIAILIAIIILYLGLGCVMDGLAMIILTVPIFYPIIVGFDFGIDPAMVPIWFGILVLCAMEVGLITPPIGINVFVINSVAEDVPLSDTFRGVLPFFISDLARIAIIVAIPATCTWLPSL